ncbi:MAG: Mov34/MPN/PAD-1 family protein [Bradymonadia bacterium]
MIPWSVEEHASLWSEMTRHASAGWPEEVCGVVSQDRADTLRVHLGVNNASMPRAAFDLAAGLLLDLARHGRRPVAFFHSHPDAAPVMSAADHHAAVLDGEPIWPGVDHIIISVYNRRPRALIIHRWSQSHRRHRPLLTIDLESAPMNIPQPSVPRP